MASDVFKFRYQEKIEPKAGELVQRIIALVHEYDGEMSRAAAVGALEFAKMALINEDDGG